MSDQHRVRNVLNELDGGRAIKRFQDAIEEITDEVTSRLGEKAKGSVTLTVVVARENEEHVSVTPSLSKKLPKKSLMPSLYFFGDKGSIHKRDPHQTDVEDVVDIKTAKGEE